MARKDAAPLNWRGLVRFLKVLAVVGLLGGGGWFSLFWTDWFHLKQFDVQANDDRREWLQENFNTYFAGRNTFLVSLEEGADALRADPSVRKAEVVRRLPSGLIYRVEYRLPVAAVAAEGQYLLLDGEGYLVRTEQTRPEKLPMISGIDVHQFVVGKPLDTVSQKELQYALSLLSLLSQTPYGENAVIGLEKTACVLTVGSGVKGRFSYRAELEDSFNRFADVFEDLKQKGIVSGLIDVSSEGYPVYRPFGE